MGSEQFTKYERARILGARALQIAMNAPLLIKISEEDLEKIKFDAIKIAETELDSGVLPISIKKPFPIKKEEKLKRSKAQKISDEEKAKIEAEEEKEKSVALQGELSKKVSETKMLKTTLDERLIHIDEIKKVNEAKTNTLEEEKIDLQEREKEFEVKIKSYDSLRNNLDTEEKKLKIKQLRIDEIVRTKDIEKELKLLEKKANK